MAQDISKAEHRKFLGNPKTFLHNFIVKKFDLYYNKILQYYNITIKREYQGKVINK